MLSKRILTTVVASLFAATAIPVAVADVDPLFTFGFTDLDGDFTQDGDRAGTFTANASAEALGGPYNSAGDVTRVLDPGDSANFDAGFLANGTDADFSMEMSITDVTGSFANATGSFMIVDADGDFITGDINGSWTRLPGNFGEFDGLAANVELHQEGDGMFEGPSGGAWDMDLPYGPIYNGAVIVLNTGAWFANDFENTNTQIEASIVPTPGAAMLVVIGLAVVSRWRR